MKKEKHEDCIFKYKFKSADVTLCCLCIGVYCPGEDKCKIKNYREKQKKIWKKVDDELIRV